MAGVLLIKEAKHTQGDTHDEEDPEAHQEGAPTALRPRLRGGVLMAAIPTLEEVVNSCYEPEDGRMNHDLLISRLREREDFMADAFRNAGLTLRADSAFVAKAIMDIGLGTPPTDDVRSYIDAQFAEHVEKWNQLFREATDGGDPGIGGL